MSLKYKKKAKANKSLKINPNGDFIDARSLQWQHDLSQFSFQNPHG